VKGPEFESSIAPTIKRMSNLKEEQAGKGKDLR
jgi:hypothetical protein